MGIRSWRARLVASDGKGAPEVAILNENWRGRLFGDRNAVGRTFRYRSDPQRPDNRPASPRTASTSRSGREPAGMYSPYSREREQLAPHLLVRSSRPEAGSRDRANAGERSIRRRDEGNPCGRLGFACCRAASVRRSSGARRSWGWRSLHRPLRGVAYSVAGGRRRSAADGPGADGKAVLIMVCARAAARGVGRRRRLGVAVFAVRPLAMFPSPS